MYNNVCAVAASCSGYIDSMCKAMNEGVPITHYLVWSYCDNFEWNNGYSVRCFANKHTMSQVCQLCTPCNACQAKCLKRVTTMFST